MNSCATGVQGNAYLNKYFPKLSYFKSISLAAGTGTGPGTQVPTRATTRAPTSNLMPGLLCKLVSQPSPDVARQHIVLHCASCRLQGLLTGCRLMSMRMVTIAIGERHESGGHSQSRAQEQDRRHGVAERCTRARSIESTKRSQSQIIS